MLFGATGICCTSWWCISEHNDSYFELFTYTFVICCMFLEGNFSKWLNQDKWSTSQHCWQVLRQNSVIMINKNWHVPPRILMLMHCFHIIVFSDSKFPVVWIILCLSGTEGGNHTHTSGKQPTCPSEHCSLQLQGLEQYTTVLYEHTFCILKVKWLHVIVGN